MEIKHYELISLEDGKNLGYVEVIGDNPDSIMRLGEESYLQKMNKKDFASKTLDYMASNMEESIAELPENKDFRY